LKAYKIRNKTTGDDLGVHLGSDEQSAINAMYREGGYNSQEEAGVDFSDFVIVATEVSVEEWQKQAAEIWLRIKNHGKITAS